MTPESASRYRGVFQLLAILKCRYLAFGMRLWPRALTTCYLDWGTTLISPGVIAKTFLFVMFREADSP